MFGWLRPRPQPPRAIASLGLTEWWNRKLTREQREVLVQIRMLSSDPSRQFPRSSAVNFLVQLATQFGRKSERRIAKVILAEAAVQIHRPDVTAIDLHFLYGAIVATWYPGRDHDPEAIEVTKQACRHQIAIANQAAMAFRSEFRGSPLPGHVGYRRLIAILRKEGERQEAALLARHAAAQGWNGFD